MRIFALSVILSFTFLSQAHGGECDKQLSFDFNATPVLLMSPKGSLAEKDLIYSLIDRRSRDDGFQSYFGVNFLEQTWQHSPYTIFRFTRLKRLGEREIQVLLYGGQITSFERIGKDMAEIELSTSSEKVSLVIDRLDSFYIL